MLLKHRHFLGLPIFLFLLGITLWTGGEQLRGDMFPADIPQGSINARGADRAFSLQRGVYGLLQEDGVLQDDGMTLAVHDGTVLVVSEGAITLQAGNIAFSGFHGGFLASKTGQKLSVFSLTTPVLLQRDAFRVIIPVGMWGEWMEDAVPSTFDLQAVADVQGNLRLLDPTVTREELRTLSQLQPAPLPSFDGGAVLWGGERLHRLQEILQSGDLAEARALLDDEDVQRLLRSDDLLPAVFTTLLVSAKGLPSVAQDLLTETRDNDLWLLASFHPAFVSAAWETPGSVTMPRELRLLRWLQLPSSDVGAALPARVVDRWTVQLRNYLDSAELADRTEFLHALLVTLLDYRTFVESSEFPQRQQRYAGALQQVVGPFASALPREDQDLYAPWKTVDAIAPYSEPPSAVAPEPTTHPVKTETAEPAEPFDATELETRTKRILLTTGALFTTQTTVHAESARHVTVKGLLFVSADGEHIYDFIFDPEKNEVRDMYRERELLPYPLSLEAFGKWARGGK